MERKILTVLESEMPIAADSKPERVIDGYLFHHIMQYFQEDNEDVERRRFKYRITIEEI